jgi:hypothetical protein
MNTGPGDNTEADVSPRRGPALMRHSYDQCVRCGKATAWGKSVCKDCNPAGLPEPSPSQYHATVFITVLVALAVLVVLAMLLR